MKKIKLIKTEQDYQDSLKLLDELMDLDPDPSSANGEKLELLASLIKDYESIQFPTELPTALDAIKFRMKQENLKPIDLVPFLGSKSRVSEIFSGKRNLNLTMIKALSEGLNIPIKSLLKDNKDNNLEEISCWDKKTLKKMKERNYFGKVSQITDETLRKFFSVIDTSSLLINGIPRKSNYRATPLTDKKALLAWSTLIIKKAQQVKLPKKYQPGSIDELFLKNLLQLSMQRNGPLEAIKELNKKGVVVVVEPHLPKTHLDGILILKDRKKPIIGLTLRYDRLDYFWFTLMHELSHLILHYNEDIDLFYDEIEGIRMANLDKREKEADSLAQEIILPEEKWEISPAKIVPSEMAAKSLARELKIHESIIAGQIRHRGNNYKFLSKVVNKEKIRKYFYQ